MKIKDERVVQLNNKIHSEAYFVVLFLCAASFFMKCYGMNLPFSQYAAELCIILLSTVYIMVRSMLLGSSFMDSTKRGKKLTVAVVLAVSLAIAIVGGIRNYSQYGARYTGISDGHFIAVCTVMFLSSVVFISVVFALLHWFNKAGERRLEKKLREEEEQD